MHGYVHTPTNYAPFVRQQCPQHDVGQLAYCGVRKPRLQVVFLKSDQRGQNDRGGCDPCKPRRRGKCTEQINTKYVDSHF